MIVENLITIANNYGLDNQKNKLVEEMAELTVAVMKNDPDNFIEELGDVLNVIDEVLMLLDSDSLYTLATIREAKAERQVRRIEEHG